MKFRNKKLSLLEQVLVYVFLGLTSLLGGIFGGRKKLEMSPK